MKEQISIKVSIMDRVFPLKVSSDEEASIRKAAELVNKKVRTYIEQYLIRDKQAALSMCALELATELLNSEAIKDIEKGGLISAIEEIERLIPE
jgi:cell division protein ZapA (FtsZ GTPase activity inhibitor)